MEGGKRGMEKKEWERGTYYSDRMREGMERDDEGEGWKW